MTPEYSSDNPDTSEQKEHAEDNIVFLRCDEFMVTTISPTLPISFFDEQDMEIEGVIHAWPLTEDMVPFFLEEERQITPERSYYQVKLPQGWHIYAINWRDLNSYVSVASEFDARFGIPAVQPSVEEFDSSKHLGSIIQNDQGLITNVPYQVVLSPRPIDYLA